VISNRFSTASVPGMTNSIAFYAAILFVLSIAHAGVRIGRKTQVQG
jgi:hypothetical protein